MGSSGSGTIESAVASDIKGPWFDSSHWQLLLNIYLLLTVRRKDDNKWRIFKRFLARCSLTKVVKFIKHL